MSERERIYITIPSDDPRFAEMREVLEHLKARGRRSPVPRMLAEWALLGFLLMTGQIPIVAQSVNPEPRPQTGEYVDELVVKVAPQQTQDQAIDALLQSEGWDFDM